MRTLIDTYLDSVSYLFEDDLISFNSFFTVILAECAYLWVFPHANALGLTIVLLAFILNVLVFGNLKGRFVYTRIEPLIAKLYIIFTCAIFVVGLIIGKLQFIPLVLIPFLFTYIAIVIRDYQDSTLYGDGLGIWQKTIEKFIHFLPVWIISQFLIVGVPLIVLAILVIKIPGLPMALKLIIAILYIVLSPLLSLLEDNLATENIFEMAFDILWNENVEKNYRAFLKEKNMNLSIEEQSETNKKN